MGPRSRSEIDFLEKKIRKSREHRDPPFSYLRDIRNVFSNLQLTLEYIMVNLDCLFVAKRVNLSENHKKYDD